jgi:hypothetical protein
MLNIQGVAAIILVNMLVVILSKGGAIAREDISWFVKKISLR